MLTGAMAATALTACSTPKVKIAGVQIPVLPPSNLLSVAADAPPVTVPPAASLSGWPQVLAGPAHAPGNIAGPSAMTQNWRTGIGAAGGFRQPLAASPLLAQGQVFTMDSSAAVSAFSAATGRQSWRTITRPKHMTVQNIGGGIGFDNGIIYASTGYSELLALDAGSGKILWRQKLDYPARSAPTIAGGVVAVVTQNDLLLTFDPTSGAPGWRFIGQVVDSPTSVAVSGAPAFADGIIVAGFASGTLAALDINSGTPIWEESLASSYGQASPLDFSDIVAPPVISNGVVYAIGLGNSAIAIDLHSGAKIWTKDATGTQPYCLAGDFAYLTDINQNLSAIHADDGLVSWMVQLPNWTNMKHHRGTARSWNGPVMINGHLLLTSNLGDVITVDPVTGGAGPMTKLAGPADMAPIVTSNAIYMLTRDATLTAYA
jgi:outer membrane protein assembly factor BamB